MEDKNIDDILGNVEDIKDVDESESKEIEQIKMMILMDEILYRTSVILLSINAIIDSCVFIFTNFTIIRIITMTMCILSLITSQLLIFLHDKKFGGD